MTGARQALFCLDLGATIDGDGPWLEQAAIILSHARRQNWLIAHALSKGGRSRPVRKELWPSVIEPVFEFDGTNALECSAARDWCFDASRTPAYFIGAVFSRVGLATAMAGHEAGKPFCLIEDACGPERPRGSAASAQIAPLRETSIVWRTQVARVLNEATGRIIDFSRYRRLSAGDPKGAGNERP